MRDLTKPRPISEAPEGEYVLVYKEWGDPPRWTDGKFRWAVNIHEEVQGETSYEGYKRRLIHEIQTRVREWDDGTEDSHQWWLPQPVPPDTV